MFKGVPHDRVDDPVDMLIAKMDQHGITKALPACRPTATESRSSATPTGSSRRAMSTPEGMGGASSIRPCVHGEVGELGHRPDPTGALNDKKMYPIYSKCIELDIPIFVRRCTMRPLCAAYVGLLDGCAGLPELHRHGGGEPELMVAPVEVAEPAPLDVGVRAQTLQPHGHRLREHPQRRQGDHGYYPMGSTSTALPSSHVPFRDHVWPKFLYEHGRVLVAPAGIASWSCRTSGR
jgi:hypothetical protein